MPGGTAFSVLGATAATAVAESAAGQQQDHDDDEQDCEHGHLLGLGWVGSCMT